MSLRIIRAGIFDTIQDSGRTGYRHLGINPNGSMDCFSAQLANALLGKDLGSALIECAFPASTILFDTPTIICLSGADFSPSVDGQPIRLHQPFYLPGNSMLRFNQPIKGRWCYLATLPDLKIDAWLGSYSTNTKIGAGGNDGRSLKNGEQLQYKNSINFQISFGNEVQGLDWSTIQLKDFHNKEIRFVKGHEWNWLTTEALQKLRHTDFYISRQSDRMGYRLQSQPLSVTTNQQLVSSAVSAGTIQLLPDGQLIVLMADHQTTGGYPRIGHVITTDLSILAQQQAGKSITFQEVELAAAEQAFWEQQNYLRQLKNACTFKMQNLIHAAM